MKNKVHVMQDEELDLLLGELQESHQKLSTIPLQKTAKSSIMPFIRKQPFMRTRNHEEEKDELTSKVHYMSDAELVGLLNNLNAPESSKMPQPLDKLEPHELNEDRWEPLVLNQPPSNRNIDSLSLREYSKIYLVVNPDAIKNTENQKKLTDLIGKVMAERRIHRRRDDDATAEMYDAKEQDDSMKIDNEFDETRLALVTIKSMGRFAQARIARPISLTYRKYSEDEELY